uniref:Sodium-dependent multivitamin transporter n=1 Tax=Ditylenchus dipsaci TaxID=166011 RepID=A0A915D2Y8_9BILA
MSGFENAQISVLDYAIFGFSLVISIGTGIYHAIQSRRLFKKKEGINWTAKEEFLIGGVLMLGLPAEIFERGTHIWMSFIVGGIASVITAMVFLPVFYKIKCICIHEYFIHRYNSMLIRRTYSGIFLIFNLVSLSVIIYAPAVALSKVIAIDKWLLVVVFGTTATIYTSVGGLKAVVWTDSFQALFMYGGVIALIWNALGNEKVGGISRVWKLGIENGQLTDLFRFDPSIFQYNSFWINLFSGTITWLASFGINQLSIQHYNSVPTLRNAKQIIYFTIIPFSMLVTTISFIGLLVLAYFYNCNPLETQEIVEKDHLTMLFAFRILGTTPGLFGLYITCIMSATLSSISSNLSSSAAALYEDFLRQIVERNLTDVQATNFNKLVVLLLGIMSTILAFAAERLGGILRMCASVLGAFSGPMVGIFVLAMFVPKAGTKATMISFVVSNIIMCTICTANYVLDPYSKLARRTNSTLAGCDHHNFTIPPTLNYDPFYGDPHTSHVARISIYAYPGLGLIIMLSIGLPLVYLLDEPVLENIEHLTFWGRNLPVPKMVLDSRKNKSMSVFETAQISVLDYAVFGFSLLISLVTGIYHAIRSRLLLKGDDGIKRTAKDEFLIGGRQMPRIPIALSLLTSFLSGILMLGLPAEIFQRGTHIWMSFIVGGLASLITAIVFLPVFYKIKCTCIHEYFIHRYNSKLIRRSFSAIFLVFILVYMAIVIYAPSVAMSKVINVDKWLLILVFGATATIYTSVGGLKAVVWTDSLQALLMYGGVVALIWKALANEKVGGISRVWNLGVESGRIGDLFRFDPSIVQYNSFWINLVSGTITWLASFGVNQLSIQRYNSVPTLKNAKQIIYFTIIPFSVLVTIVSFIGLLNTSPTPGLFGLYITCIMSATLSTISSGLSSSAAAFYEDFLRQGVERRNWTDRQATSINKLIVLFFGILSTGLAFAAEPLGGILRVCVSVMGAISGPMVGIFVLAMFWPKAGVKATMISFVVSTFIMCAICFANYVIDPYSELSRPTNSTLEGCNYRNFTVQPAPNYDAYYGDPEANYFSRISIYAYPGLGMVIMLLIGVPLVYLLDEPVIKNIEHLTFWGRNLPFPNTHDTKPLVDETKSTPLNVINVKSTL